MIRLRCETGIRPRQNIKWKVPPDVWLAVAQICAQFQARSLLATGRRRVDLSKLQELHSELDLMMLYEATILELVAWEEHDRTGALTRIKSADLSKEAAQALVHAALLTKALSNTLLASDLSQREYHTDVLRPSDMEALAQWSNYKNLRIMPNVIYNDNSLQYLPVQPQQCFATI